MAGFPRARQVVEGFVGGRVAPCAVVEVGTADGPSWAEAHGTLTDDPDAPPAAADTVFDLASLTKVLATATVGMRLVESGQLELEARVSDLVPGWRGADRDVATITDLLAHSAGLPGCRPYFETRRGRESFEQAICREPLEYRPGTASIYSDLGFMLLGFLFEDVGGAPLDRLTRQAFAAIPERVDVAFGLPAEWRNRTAPTSADPLRRGVVDDRNAEALGSVAGHAGLFGTAGGVGAIARALLSVMSAPGARHPLATAGVLRRFTSPASSVSSRGLGWDTMLPTSSCGTLMSPRAFGHTGFTGTSLWIDPEAGVYVVLLTNRVYPTPGASDRIQAFRRALHDSVMEDWERSR